MKKTSERSSAETTQPTHPLPPALMQKIVQNVAADAGVEAAEILLKKAEAVTWRDGSLGCPEPGMAYSQALIEGYWVVLSANNRDYDMRVTASGHFSRCLKSKKPQPLRDSEL